MAPEKETLTLNGLIGRILETHPNIKDTSLRQQARLTNIASLILAAVCFFAGIVGLIVGFPVSLNIGLFILTVMMSVACALGRSENYVVGSVFLVSGLILSGFILGSVFPQNTSVIIILMSTVVPAFTLGIVLLPLLALVIIAVVLLITIGVLPLMASISAGTELSIFIGLVIIEGIFLLIAWFRESSETLQQDEIGILRSRLAERIEERTRFSRIAAEIAQDLISTTSLETLLDHSVSLINARMGFSFTGYYQVEQTGNKLSLRAAQGADADRMVSAGKHIDYGPPSMLGWVAENKQQRLVTRMTEDPLQLQPEMLPGNQSELAIPILGGDRLLGVLDVQSVRTTAFDNEIIVVLQMLASQIATSIQNVHLFEAEKGSIQEVAEIYLAGYKVAQSKTENDIYQIMQDLFPKIPYVSMFLIPERNELKVVAETASQLAGGQKLPESIAISIDEMGSYLGSDLFIGEGSRLSSLPYNLVRSLQQLQIFSVAVLPVKCIDGLAAILLIGTQTREPLNTTSIQPYNNFAKQVAVSLDRIHAIIATEQRITEMGTINSKLQTVAELASEISNSSQLEDVFIATQRVFQQTNHGAILLLSENNNFRIATSVDPAQSGGILGLQEWLDLSPKDVSDQLANKTLVAEVSKLSSVHYAQFHPELNKFIEGEASKLPLIQPALLKIIEQAFFQTVAFIPVMCQEQIATLLIVGARDEQPILPEIVKAYSQVANLITSTVSRLHSSQTVDRRLAEMETITAVGQEISTIRDLNTIYNTLHTRIRQLMGEVNFLVAIYTANTSSISVPYMYEKGFEGGDVTSIDTFPLGEGLTSILIRTKQPLMLVEDTENRAAALGAKIAGKPAKSWLGAPLIVSDEAIGALIVQDVDNELAFDENDLHLLTSFANQVAGAIYNGRLLGQMNARAIQLQTAAEVARDISGSLDLGELLNKAVKLIYERFNFYHAAIFMLDQSNEFATIREATGEAGKQMKRAGHKLQVGSKSIVGYVTSSGEPLIVNDTSRDATYFANPLLPETRAEVAIPLKVGQRILGALDVQSTRAYSFAEEDVRVLRILADQMAIAVINSELFADTQEHLSQHRLLHHVTTAAASGTTLEESLNSATQGLQVTLGGDRVSILLADKGKQILKVNSFAGYSEEIGKLEIHFGEGITGWVAAHQQPQRLNDVTQDPRYIQVGSNIRSELAIPLSYRGDLLGVLNVESDQVGAYNENDEELLGTLGGSLAAIISNARLIEQVRRQVDHERMLYEVTSKIRRSTDMQTIMATTTSELSKVLGARRAQITLEIEDESKTQTRSTSE